MSEVQEWSAEYNKVSNTLPAENDELSTFTGDPAMLRVELKDDTPPFIFGLAYVPEIMSDNVRWCLQSEEITGQSGFKCILLPRARTELLRKVQLLGDTVTVKSLRVIRASKSGKSLLCEVAEYCEEA